MLRSLPRTRPSSSYLWSHLRTTPRTSKIPIPLCTAIPQKPQSRQASTQHAISNPTLAGIEKRWEQMPPQEQADLWMALRDRMKVDWHELTIQEKKAGELHNLRFVICDLRGASASNRLCWDSGLRHAVEQDIPLETNVGAWPGLIVTFYQHTGSLLDPTDPAHFLIPTKSGRSLKLSGPSLE